MEYLTEFGGAYLEDSYLMEIIAEGPNLRSKMLFALTTDNAAYSSLVPGETHCFRAGSFLIEKPNIVEWHAGKPALASDAEKTFDLGSFELYRDWSNKFRFLTEWFDATSETQQLLLSLE